MTKMKAKFKKGQKVFYLSIARQELIPGKIEKTIRREGEEFETEGGIRFIAPYDTYKLVNVSREITDNYLYKDEKEAIKSLKKILKQEVKENEKRISDMEEEIKHRQERVDIAKNKLNEYDKKSKNKK